MKELTNIEMKNTFGGEGFAHDAGCAIRYAIVFVGWSRITNSFRVGKK